MRQFLSPPGKKFPDSRFRGNDTRAKLFTAKGIFFVNWGFHMTDQKEEENSLTLDRKTVDVLVAQIIPTSKYFEVRFDHMQGQLDRFSNDLKDFRGDVDKRFDAVKDNMDKRFDAMQGGIWTSVLMPCKGAWTSASSR